MIELKLQILSYFVWCIRVSGHCQAKIGNNERCKITAMYTKPYTVHWKKKCVTKNWRKLPLIIHATLHTFRCEATPAFWWNDTRLFGVTLHNIWRDVTHLFGVMLHNFWCNIYACTFFVDVTHIFGVILLQKLCDVIRKKYALLHQKLCNITPKRCLTSHQKLCNITPEVV